MNWVPKWPSLGILIIILLEWGTTSSAMQKDEESSMFLAIFLPSSHVALSGDLVILVGRSSEGAEGNIEVQKSENTSKSFLIRVSYLLDDISELIGEIPVNCLPSKNQNISVVIPCGFFTRGGVYPLRLEYKDAALPLHNVSTTQSYEPETSSMLDVKWPVPSILLESQQLTTYPNKPIAATIGYDRVSCEPSTNFPVSVYILQLIYCGSSVVACYLRNNTHAQVLYYEEVRGFASRKVIYFRCDTFGLPGYYAVKLKASNENPTAPNVSVYIKVEWSEEFRLTVHARSIYPCEGSGGVAVLFEYPSCRLEGDRVRVYGRLKADVTSMASPSSLRYVTELRSIPGKHSLTFDCDLFTEKFVEYCFVYVSQAITGAMADVKISCVPTFPFQDGETAGWGAWSSWSPCSSSCFGGIRNRYRFCDTPPPKYGAQFCQGKAVETEFCSGSNFENFNREEWTERIENSECHGAILAAARPGITAEIGLQCRCGCIITFQEEVSRKILGANTQSCPGRSFWLLQAQTNFVIGLHLDQLQFPCPGQYLRARDGDSLNANLLTDIAFDRIQHATKTLITTGQNLLLEFFSDELTASGEACVGGFLGHAAVLEKKYLERNGTVVPFKVDPTNAENRWIFWKPAHLATASLLILIFFIFIFLTLQFVMKYRKYRIAEDLDNLSSTSELVYGRYASRSTIITEVVSMIGTSTRNFSRQACQHVEERYNSMDSLTGCKDGSSMNSNTLKLNNPLDSCSERTITSMNFNDETLLPASCVITQTQPEVKYAYPVKLQILDTDSPEEKSINTMGKVEEGDGLTLSKFYQLKDYVEGKESSPVSRLSSPSILRSGKETKERRNRERLLQGPGSEFSLTNPDSELELDYYDYNVANASAAPGSYLGMDPAFLVWIPPIDDSKLPTEELFLGSKRNSILALESEGAALTPSEYRRMKLSGIEDIRFDGENHFALEERSLNRFDAGNFSLEEITKYSKSRPTDRALPICRIFEESDAKAGVETILGGTEENKSRCVIPNRRISEKDGEPKEQSSSSKDQFGSCGTVSEHVEEQEKNSVKEKYQEDFVMFKDSSCEKGITKESGNVSRKYKNLLEYTKPIGSKKYSVDIPMIELAGNPLKTFVHNHNTKDIHPSIDIQSPDYGIENCLNQKSFFDQNIRFVDEDEDEFID